MLSSTKLKGKQSRSYINYRIQPVSPTTNVEAWKGAESSGQMGLAAFPAEARKVGMMGSTPEEEVTEFDSHGDGRPIWVDG